MSFALRFINKRANTELQKRESEKGAITLGINTTAVGTTAYSSTIRTGLYALLVWFITNHVGTGLCWKTVKRYCSRHLILCAHKSNIICSIELKWETKQLICLEFSLYSFCTDRLTFKKTKVRGYLLAIIAVA